MKNNLPWPSPYYIYLLFKMYLLSMLFTSIPLVLAVIVIAGTYAEPLFGLGTLLGALFGAFAAYSAISGTAVRARRYLLDTLRAVQRTAHHHS